MFYAQNDGNFNNPYNLKEVCNEKRIRIIFLVGKKELFCRPKTRVVELSKSGNNSLVNFGKMIHCAEERGFGSKIKPL